MKPTLRFLVPALGLVAVWPVARAADETKPAAKSEKKELRVITTTDAGTPRASHGAIIRHLTGMGEKESVTFLGVETAPVSPTLVAQLGLTDGAGLVVNHVVPDSPAAGALKAHDILLKLDDQILIEQRQLAVLIRNHKEGDEVTLTYLRGGKQATAKVKLAKHDVPKMSLQQLPFGPNPGAFALGPGNFDGQVPPRIEVQNGEDVDRLLGLIDPGSTPGQRHLNILNHSGPGDRTISVTVNTGNSNATFNDDQGTLELSIREGQKSLVAKNAKGEQIFSGPVNTPEERKAMPADVRSRLEKLEDSTQFSGKTGGDFRGAETKIFRPRGQGIALPPQPAPAPRRSTFVL